MNTKLIKIASVVAASFIMLSATSCKKKETTSNSSGSGEESYGSVTIKGKVDHDLNTTASGLEPVASGLIIAKVNTQDLITSPTPSTVFYDKFYYGTISNGSYTLTVEANKKPVSITIYPQDFEDQQIIPATPPATGTTTQRKVFTSGSITTTGVRGGIKIHDFTYN